MWRQSLVLVFSGALLLSACASKPIRSVELDAARAFYDQTRADQQRSFRKHSLQEQLALFFFGNQVRHPPALHLAQCFALNGASGVDLLRSKLQSGGDDLTVRDIAMLLATIDAMGRYDVAGDAPLMSALKAHVANMSDAGWRDTAERKVESIGHNRRLNAQAPECD